MSPKSLVSLLINDEDSQDSINENVHNSTKIHTMDCDANGDLTLDDIRLLVELFYLPYQHGATAQKIFSDFYWLRFNYNSHQNVKENIFRFIFLYYFILFKLNEWRCRALLFNNHAKSIACLLEKFISIHNRALLYDLYNYIHDMNSTIDLCSKYLHWIGLNFILF
jgi:protein O-GlcNAcase/histone acetyltransferase